jgi:hypothetical protein
MKKFFQIVALSVLAAVLLVVWWAGILRYPGILPVGFLLGIWFVYWRSGSDAIGAVVGIHGFEKQGRDYVGTYQGKVFRVRPGLVVTTLGLHVMVAFDNVTPPVKSSWEIQTALSEETRRILKESWDGITLDVSFTVTPQELRTGIYVNGIEDFGDPQDNPAAKLPKFLDLLVHVRQDLERRSLRG